MPHRTLHVDTYEMRKALDDLLQTFLVVSPRNADLPAVKRARDLVSRLPQVVPAREGSLSGTMPREVDIPETFITGSD